jgi:hypothetical protein
MDTAMHAEAMPDADRSTLGSPAEVASRVVDLLESIESLPSGSRLDATRLARVA